MSALKHLLAFLAWLSVSATALAQATNTNTLRFVIQPQGTNVLLLSESTNLFTVAFFNLAITNSTVEPDPSDPTINVTNSTVTALFSNVNVRGSFTIGTNTNSFTFLDDGAPPDKDATNAVYSANVIIPFSATNFVLPILFTIRADDISVTNADGTPITVRYQTNVLAQYQVIPRPPNDKFTNAIKAVAYGGVYTGSNNWAMMEAGEPKHAGVKTADASVWWVWSTPVSTNVLIDTAGSGFAPALAVYTGNKVNGLTQVAASADDTLNHLKANVTFNALAGETYRIAVAGQNTNGMGSVRLRVAPGATPDTRPPQTSITSPNRQVLISTESLVVSGIAKEPEDWDSGISNVLIQVNNLPPTNAIGAYPWSSWSANVTVPAGTNVVRAYAIDYAGNVGLADAIVVRYVNPTNDDFASPVLLTGVGGLVSAVNGRATLEPGEPLHAGNKGGHSIWYTWRAPSDGTLSLNTQGSTSGEGSGGPALDTLLDVYVGTNLTSLVLVTNNDDAELDSKYSALAVGVLSNQLYRISVDGYGGDAGTIQLLYSFVAPSPGQYYALNVTALPGGLVTPSGGIFASGARVQLTATPAPRFVFAGWEGDVVSSQNPLSLVMDSDVSVTARFQNTSTTGVTNKVSDDFESGDLTRLAWTTEAVEGWRVQTNGVQTNGNLGGKYAVRCGAITNNGASSLRLTALLAEGVGAFDLRTSSEQGWDYLEFRLNGELLQRWSGETPWTNYVFAVKAGTNTLEWRYAKDSSWFEGEDFAYLDNVYVPLVSSAGGGDAGRLAIVRLSDGQVQVTLQGAPSRAYSLEASSDMNFWFEVDSKSSGSGIVQFLDPEAAGYPWRFYRAIAH